jgi:hypothetical protein
LGKWTTEKHWQPVWWLMPIIPATQEVAIRRITVWGQIRQKVHEIPPQPIAGCRGCTPVIPATAGSINRKITVQSKEGWRHGSSGRAQALNLNPSIAKKKKKKKEEEEEEETEEKDKEEEKESTA